MHYHIWQFMAIHDSHALVADIIRGGGGELVSSQPGQLESRASGVIFYIFRGVILFISHCEIKSKAQLFQAGPREIKSKTHLSPAGHAKKSKTQLSQAGHAEKKVRHRS